MGLDYDNIKKKHEDGSQWSSYSDLFMVLTLVFLLLYVTSSLKGGTHSIQKHIEYQKLLQEVEDLRQQIKVYSALKDDYLQNQATTKEEQVYQELMGKLSLLQDEANEERKELEMKAAENAKKEQALNQYQQVIRNIINANMLAKSRLQKKDRIIKEKESVIAKKQKVIREKERNISSKRREIEKMVKSIDAKRKKIEEGEQKIAKVQSALEKKVKDLKKAYKRNKISEKRYKSMISEIEERSESEISQLSAKNRVMNQQLKKSNRKLAAANQEIVKKDAEKKELKSDLKKRLQKVAKDYQRRMDELQTQFTIQRNQEKRKFESQLEKEKLSAKAKARKVAEYKKKVAAQEQTFKKRLGQLETQMGESEKALKKAQSLANARKNLAKEIQRNFAKEGIKAEVDTETGDVVLSFGKEYFNTGSARLKKGMESTLKKLMPAYSKSLLSNRKTAKKIDSIEIIGFASPTYKGKYVDPNSLDEDGRKAVNFNLDLSYNRAKSIFNFIFDKKKMVYKYQKKLLPMVKVTGRSFLAEAAKGRDIASGMSQKEFCEKYDCKKAQKVLIKFDLKD